jgi:hypothetical protein
MDYKYYDNDTTENRLQNKLLKSKESPFTGGFEFADEEDENELNDFSTSANRNGEPSTTKTINHQKKFLRLYMQKFQKNVLKHKKQLMKQKNV